MTQPLLPLAAWTGRCGYCQQPMPGPTCDHCAPALARISTVTEWVVFHRRMRRTSPADTGETP